MNLAALSVRRPTLIMSFVALILVVGSLCYFRIGVDQFPDVSFPMISVVTTYRGAGPHEIETLVSKPLEEQISAISGLKHLTSENHDGYSMVLAEFYLGTDVKDAEQQVREKVTLARPNMPNEIDEPVIRRFDPADQPIVRVSLSADLTPAQIYDLAHETIKPLLEQVPNVALVQILGGTRREIKVSLDKDRLKSHELSVSMVSDRLAANSQNIPVGEISRKDKRTAFRTLGEYDALDKIRKTVVNFYGSDIPVTLQDVGSVEDTVEDTKNLAFYNGEKSLFMDIYRQSGSNTVQVADAVQNKIREINNKFSSAKGKPQLNTTLDNAKFIKIDIEDMRNTILLGILLTVFVVYLFLGNFRSTFITGMALPDSLIGSFILMYMMGFTINMITLMSLSLAVGLLIDDAIVVRENIWRHLEHGESPKDAAIHGTNEVTMAVVATTLTVISVFMPIGFLHGTIGQFFKQMGFTVVFTMAISLFDAMTVAPMLSAYLARSSSAEKDKLSGQDNTTPGFGRVVWNAIKKTFYYIFWPLHTLAYYFGHFQTWLVDFYERVMRFCLRHRWVVLLSTVVFLVIGVIFFILLPRTFMTQPDVGFYLISLEGPPGTSLEAMLATSKKVESVIRSHPENLNVALQVGNDEGETNVASIFVEMTNYRLRPKMTTTHMQEVLRDEFKVFANFSPQVGNVQMGGDNRPPFTMIVMGDDLEKMDQVAKMAGESFKSIRDLKDLDISYKTGKPEFQIIMEPDRIKSLGVSTVMAGSELRGMVDGIVPAKFRENGLEYDIRVRLQEDQRDLSQAYGSYYIPNMNNQLVRLANVATPKNTLGPTRIDRRDRIRYIQVGGQLGGLGALGNIEDDARKIMKGLEKEGKIPAGITYDFIGQAEDFQELVVNMVIAMVLGLIFMYLILATLYESIIMPLLIMTALPLAGLGAFGALLFTGQVLSIMSMIALIMLMGLVAKNSILLVDYTYQLMRRGRSRDDAIIEAGKIRLRPILMTTFALIAGMTPLAMALSEVSRFRQSMGIAVIGGLVSSTLLTLIVIPSMFSWVDRFRVWTRKVLGRPALREVDHEEAAAKQ